MVRPRTRATESTNDPLAEAMAPPDNETLDAREARMSAEAEAARISEEIDARIERERLALKKAPKAVKLLLLGESPLSRTWRCRTHVC
jgi:guanine nucleotide-binding protein alpha-1 subunit